MTFPLPQVSADAASAREPTEVGSYFIANYPPFSAWRAEHAPRAAAALDAPARTDTPLGLYLHIPFCRKRCKFCYFRVYTDKNAGEVDVYTDALAREVSLYAGRKGLAGRQFEFVYFGGGTPSFLSNEQLKRLIGRIREHWNWDAAREVTFECEPGTLKESKLAVIREIGVTRLSLGVEHFDDDVLEYNGRAHKSAEIFRAYEWARATGFPQINIDLIAGMVGETEDKWKDTVEKAVRLDPDSVTIYQLELPYNAVFSRESLVGGTTPTVADWATKRRWVDYAFRQFEGAGYGISSAYTLVKKGRHAGFIYRDSLWHGADMVGTGVASFSHFGGVHYQNHDQWDDYIARVQRGELPIARALPVEKDSLLIRELVLQLKTGRIDPGYFAGKFGVDVSARFAEAWAGLRSEGMLEAANVEVRLSREGLLRVDTLLPRFFEKPYRDVRYT
ncbi:MAG: coproporphyrinogen III oxidase [Planctomycetota bacterium]|nr:MAG: coproporphyrinogen III oxidase [Planctomycetota bacterium]